MAVGVSLPSKFRLTSLLQYLLILVGKQVHGKALSGCSVVPKTNMHEHLCWLPACLVHNMNGHLLGKSSDCCVVKTEF